MMRTGETLPYEFSDGTLELKVPVELKVGKVTDVIVVEFAANFDVEPYLFKHW